jgi:hypothetical protein
MTSSKHDFIRTCIAVPRPPMVGRITYANSIDIDAAIQYTSDVNNSVGFPKRGFIYCSSFSSFARPALFAFSLRLSR